LEGENQSIFPNNVDPSREEIRFFLSQNYSVLFVDMIDSTRITAEITNAYKVRKYYEVFLREMSAIARMFNAKVVKNSGDCIVCYFPLTSDPANRPAFLDVIKCGTAMVAARYSLNAEMNEEKLPSLSYRISADYGRVELAISKNSKTEDLFGATVNICSKINHFARPNGMVIGGDLFQLIRRFSFSGYRFEECGSFSLGFKQPYPLYSVVGENAVDPVESNWSTPASDFNSRIVTQNHNSSAGDTNNPKQSEFNIMVVDDEPDILLTFKEILETGGYNAVIFVDSREALRHYVTNEPAHYSLVIMDIRMPIANGLQLYQRLKVLNPDVRVLFISALDAREELCSIFSEIPPQNVLKNLYNVNNFSKQWNRAYLHK
jgi:two-component system, OmpR family, response regulator ChvI